MTHDADATAPVMATSQSTSALEIRAATAADVPLILEFIRELAVYEREPDAAVATAEDLLRDGFGENPKFRVLLAFVDGLPAGHAFYYYYYSTWAGRSGLWLEDLWVRPALRKHGVAGALMRELARTAERENCCAVAWLVLDWNQLAIDFYEKLGAKRQGEWLIYKLPGAELKKLAKE